jgi:hypothetical protein
MIRMILISIVVALLVLCGSSIALYQFFGWKGLIALPVIVIAMVWIVKKMIGMVIKKFALGMFGMKSGVLKGATVNVHSVTPVAKPVVEREESDDDDEDEGLSPAEKAELEVARREAEEAEATEERENPKHYFDVDMTIVPHESVDADSVWEPTELMLLTERAASLTELEDKDAGNVYRVKVWDGNAFGPDEPGKYPGQQRLLVTFAVKAGTSLAWLQYYNEALGQVEFPEWRVDSSARAVGLSSASQSVETGI